MLATEIGLKQTTRIKQLVCNALSVGLFFSVLILIFGLLLSQDVIDWLANQQATSELAWEYIQILIIGNVAFALSSVAAGAHIAFGDTASNRNALTVGFFANLILNPLLTFGLDMGVPGLAWATLIIKVAQAIYLLSVLSKRLCYKPFPSLDITLSLDIFRQVLPARLSFFIMIVGSFIITAFASRFGDFAVAGYSVGLRLEQVLLLPALGLNAAVLAIAGQNFGAGNYRRIAKGSYWDWGYHSFVFQ